MNKKWLIVLLAGILILTLSACTGSPASTQIPEPTPTPMDDIEMDTEEDHDGDADAAAGSDTDSEEEEGDGNDETVIIDAAAIFSDRCSRCHGAERQGGAGPPLLPASLTKDPSAYVETITNGSGQMPTWGGRLSSDEINAMVEFIMSDPQ